MNITDEDWLDDFPKEFDDDDSLDMPVAAGEHYAQSNADDTDVYSTDPDDAVLTQPGWVDFHGMEVTALPLTDKKTGLFARLRYDDAKAVADRLDAELLTEKDWISLHAASKTGEVLELAPVILSTTPDFQIHMASLAYAKREDKGIKDQLAAKWNGEQPVTNAGKYWLDGGYNFGWWVDPKMAAASGIKGRDSAGNPIIQAKGGAHIDASGKNTHTDYSQLTMLKKKSGGMAAALASLLTSGMDVGALSPADTAAYALIKAKWGNLYKWGVKEHLPFLHPSWESWEAFSAKWESGNPDTDLHGQTIDVEVAENYASGYGYPGPYKVPADAIPSQEGGPPIAQAGDFGTRTKVTAPSAEDQTDMLAYGAKAEAIKKQISDAAKEAVKSAIDAERDAIGSQVDAIPWYFKASAVAALVIDFAAGVFYLKGQVGALLPRK